MKPITDIQRAVLCHAAAKPDGTTSAYDAKVGTGRRVTVSTMRTLREKGLLRRIGTALGRIAFPQNADYQITDAGRKMVTKPAANLPTNSAHGFTEGSDM